MNEHDGGHLGLVIGDSSILPHPGSTGLAEPFARGVRAGAVGDQDALTKSNDVVPANESEVLIAALVTPRASGIPPLFATRPYLYGYLPKNSRDSA